MKNLRFGLASLTIAAALFVACGGHPGGSVGDPCSVVGSSEECLEDEICDDLTDYGPHCLLLCEDHEDCDAGEQCNGVSGNNQKGCHPAEVVE